MKKLESADVIGIWHFSPDLTEEIKSNIDDLTERCNKLIGLMELAGVVFYKNPSTKSIVSGATLGGFRPKNSSVGASRSNHKIGKAVDIFDPKNEIDEFCMNNLALLEQCGIWIEHPSATEKWSHWQSVPPKSGRRVFYP